MKNIIKNIGINAVFVLSFLSAGCEDSKKDVYIEAFRDIDNIRVMTVQVAETLTFKTKCTEERYLVVGSVDYEINCKNIKKIKQTENEIVMSVDRIELDAIVDQTKTRPFKTYLAPGYKENKLHIFRKKYFSEARKLVLAAGSNNEYVLRARKMAEELLRNMFCGRYRKEKIIIEWER